MKFTPTTFVVTSRSPCTSPIRSPLQGLANCRAAKTQGVALGYDRPRLWRSRGLSGHHTPMTTYVLTLFIRIETYPYF